MKKKISVIIISVLTVCIILPVIFLGIINIIPPKHVIENNPFINNTSYPMIAAHRGGKEANPENTMKAYKASVYDFEVEILESDLWLTKDNYLVYNHDHSINRTSDAELFYEGQNNYVEDFTLEELKNFNFGYNFEKENYKDIVGLNDINRKEVLKNNDLQIVEASELFAQFYETNKDLLFIVEIKNSNEKGFIAADILANILENDFPDYKDNIVIGTFNSEVEDYLKANHPTLLRGASEDAATSFIVTQLLKVNIFDKGDFVCLQIPLSEKGLKLAKKTYINRAHRRNIAVQYWTINEEEEMRMLIDLKVDAIMTDDPELLKRVIDSYK